MMGKKTLVTLKRFGAVKDTFCNNFEMECWGCKFGNDLDDPKSSGLIMQFVFDKKEYPDKNDIPMTKKIKIEVID